jgi:putative aldouronate transport system permease protein
MKSRQTTSKDTAAMQIIVHIFILVFAVSALYPFAALVSSSFTTEHSLIHNGYRLINKEFSLAAYRQIFCDPGKIINSYGITISVTVIGTAASLFCATMAAYVLFRKEVKYRNQLAFFLYFTELFNGGLVSYYIIVGKTLGLRNNYLVMILVPLFSTFNILILRNFLKSSIPYSLIESAKMDGANDFAIFMKIVLPLSKAALASIGLFIALGYWNDWWTPMMFIEKEKLYSLQYTLYQMLSAAQVTQAASDNVSTINVPRETLRLAMTVIATGPIVLLYPFVQKYFVAGITIGSVKE